MSDKPIILVFDDMEQDYYLDTIKDEAKVYTVSFDEPDAPAALLKQQPSARAIWLLDSTITSPKFKDLCDQVVDYVRNGGTAIISGSFMASVDSNDFNNWMRVAWKLPWRYGQYVNTEVVFQSTAVGPPRKFWRDGLVAAYIQKGHFLKNVAPSDSWYASLPEAVSESLVFPVEAQTSIAFGKIGKGWLGWTGDVNILEETVAAVHAMMGLNEWAPPA